MQKCFHSIKKCKRSNFPVWFSSKLKGLIFDKKLAHKKFKRTGNLNDYQRFSKLRNLCCQLSEQNHHDYIIKIENDISTNPRSSF